MAVSEEAQAVKDFRRRLEYNMLKVCTNVGTRAWVGGLLWLLPSLQLTC